MSWRTLYISGGVRGRGRRGRRGLVAEVAGGGARPGRSRRDGVAPARRVSDRTRLARRRQQFVGGAFAEVARDRDVRRREARERPAELAEGFAGDADLPGGVAEQ